MLAQVDRARLSCRILVVEDDPDDIYLLRRAFRAAGDLAGRTIEIRTVANGLEALSTLVRHDMLGDLPDIVMLDLNMPVMDGIQFLRAMRGELSLTSNPALPMIVLTTSDQEAVHDAARQAGATTLFVKPQSEAALARIASMVIRHHG